MVYPGSGGVLKVVGAGNYAVALNSDPARQYQCGEDDLDLGPLSSPYSPVVFADNMLADTLRQAALFDLGPNLSWVPRRVAPKQYTLLVTNNDMTPHAFAIKSLVGPVASIAELPMGQNEKTTPIGQGWLPFPYDNATTRARLGTSTMALIAGLDTRAFLVTLSSDNTSALPPRIPSTAPTARPRVLRLSKFAGNLRTEILKRPSFRNFYRGVVLDWGCVISIAPLVQNTTKNPG